MRTARVSLAVMALAVIVGAAAITLAQSTLPQQAPLVIKSTAGSELYRFYCSNCHGLDATGRPSVTEGGVAAPDLTVLARPSGVFPRDRVEAVIVHGTTKLPAHGLTDMPVWGAIFRALDPSDAMVRVRIDNLIEYLESIQNPPVRRGTE